MEADSLGTIRTVSKIYFDPVNPDEEKIKIIDIAHALSMLCRANGHFQQFFSVAQHCINCAQEAKARNYSQKVQLACLLHDASEAYISDITRPVKQHLPEYLPIESRLQDIIWNKFLPEPLTAEENRQVFEIDDAQLYHEFLYFMEERVFDKEPKLYHEPDFRFRGFQKTEEEFLSVFRALTDSHA